MRELTTEELRQIIGGRKFMSYLYDQCTKIGICSLPKR
ncbi:ComC/BlpC family leader-containing pheromone/bacteriocin [Aerococcus vaginalis]